MTVIAWDGKTLAADRQATFGGTPVPYRKVFKAKRRDGDGFVLFGCAGASYDCYTYERWALGKMNEQPDKFTELCVLSIDEKRRIWQAAEGIRFVPVRMPYWAIGTGANYALGAMASGKSAREAVKIAMRLDNSCGLGIDVVRF